ncbi:MAG: hypothetical protein LBT48_02315 [Prevotellaceae bacterium]|jgi:hypothetical protein|nr:hypothetical protein [Prevotellaceae bacterium]
MSQQVGNLIIPKEVWSPSEQFPTYEAYVEYMNSVFAGQNGETTEVQKCKRRRAFQVYMKFKNKLVSLQPNL